MKKGHLLILLLLIFSTISCSKKNDSKPESTNIVNINGTNYATVKIGTQTWTAVNYNGPGGENYNRNLDNDPVTGKFYSLTQAMAITLPAGWRLPTREDADKLLLFLGAVKDINNNVQGDSVISAKLRSKSGWSLTQGTNNSGFNAYPVGLAYNAYDGTGTDTTFWTASAGPFSFDQYTLRITNDKGYSLNFVTVEDRNYISSCRFSVRFVKDN
ncbi:FISUMP domain-containing protein [Mucilaginibacter sp. RCC_168]|uniref:FISUMP domain-containing protein n=1 Tax=Mucilaginibacter sp. RCC_168 TaxID=3239221 RepID=UPI0035264447